MVKKKKLLSMFMAVALLFGSAAALPDGVFSENTSITASAVIDGDWEYVILDDDTISLTKYNGGGGTVTIPSTFEGRDVVSFGTIFKGNKNIAKVIIPDTITSIADNAFNNCTNLTGVTIGSGVKNIGDNAFYNCYSITSIAFPSGLTNIGNYAFYDCYSIKSLAIPGSVKAIGDYAFARKDYYDYVGSKEPPQQIGMYTIYDSGSYSWGKCMSISNVAFEEGLERIGSHSFYNCFNLKSVSVPKSVISIKESAFGMTWYETTGVSASGRKGWEERVRGFTINCYKDSIANVIAKSSIFNYNLIDVTYVEAKTPKCTEPGNREYWVYNEDEYYSDNHATQMLDENEIVIPATGHLWSDWETITKESCTTDGLKMRYCTACGKTEKPKIDKLGHDYIATVVDPTCTKEGYTEHKCSRCSDSYKDNIVSALGHDYVDTVVSSTCTKEGYTLHKCSRCGKEYTDSKTPLADHTPDEAVSENVVPATCTADGKYDEVVYCKDCHKELSRTEKIINKHGHSYVWKNKVYDSKKNTITQTGKCSVCGDTTTRTTKNATTRLSGKGRFETAVEISKASFPDGAKTVVLAYGLNYADALAGVSLAKAMNAPILLTNLKALPNETLAEIKRLKATDVIILGGTGAVGAEVETALKKEGLKTERIAGKTRFETATKIAEKMQLINEKAPEDVFFVYAFNSADALSVSAVAAVKGSPVIYLNTKGELDDATAAYLASVKGKVKNAYVIGGSGVISDDMMKKAGNVLGVTPTRVFGANRFETCVAVNEKFKDTLSGDSLCVATGMDFPDALAGGVFAALNKAPLFLINGKVKTLTLSDSQKAYLKTKGAGFIITFGGTGVVPDSHIVDIAKNTI
ncbi:MAG: cell wall-binding repeat-containing protein [Ruminococcus sp.]|nr:cell wall-binding repeat-containing protein [Ruminococcus sp.]